MRIIGCILHVWAFASLIGTAGLWFMPAFFGIKKWFGQWLSRRHAAAAAPMIVSRRGVIAAVRAARVTPGALTMAVDRMIARDKIDRDVQAEYDEIEALNNPDGVPANLGV